MDDDLKIDFGPDTVLQMIRHGRDLCGVRNLVFTHHHSDHIVPTELEWVSGPFTNTPPETPIAIYGNAQVAALIQREFPTMDGMNLILMPPLQALEPVITSVGDRILPLPADHAPGSFVLHITRACDNKTLFYGHDSGIYPDVTLDALSVAGPVNIAVFDCTYGGQESKNRGHLGIDGVLLMAKELRRRGVVAPHTRCIATHFSHNGGLLHEELVETFLPHGIMVAFDGICIKI